jgi:L-seryl-tRNA(Ser) seleniumtransferase
MSNVLRSLPSVGELLESPPLKALVNRVSHNVVVARASQFLDDLRGQVQNATGVNIPTPSELAERIATWIASERGGVRPIINASGILLHPELSGPPLPAEALAALAEVAGGFAPLELDLASGHAAARDAGVASLLCRLSGAEAGHVAGSHAGAALATLAAIGAGNEVLVARSQIGHVGGRRLPDLLASAGAVLREVGTTHQTSASDFAAAIGPRTSAILLPTAADYAIVGATQQISATDLAVLARRHNLPLIHDLGLGGLVEMTRFGLTDQPFASQSIEAGADLVLLAGNKLLGGPECGIVLGKRALIRKIKEHSLAACTPAVALTLAALEATLRLYEDPASIDRTIPLLSLLNTPLANLRNRAERMGPQITAAGVATVEIVDGTTSLAGQPVPGQTLPTIQLALTPSKGNASSLAAALRQGSPGVIGSVAQGRVLLDLRSVPPNCDIGLVRALEALSLPKSPLPPEAPQVSPVPST